MSDVDVDAQEWRWRLSSSSSLSLSLSVLTLLQPLCAQLHKQTKLVLPSPQTQANTCSHTVTYTLSLHTQSHTLARWRTHARWELVAHILSFVYALELFIYVCKYTLFGCVCMFECVSFFWPVCFVLFPARPLNCSTRRSRIFCLSTSASLSASGSLSGCRMVSEYVEWLVACLPANWVLLLSVVVILVTFQWALRFALFIAAVLFVFWFSVFLFHFHLLLLFLFLFLFSFYFWLLPLCGRIYKCIWMVSACLSALFFPHFGWFYLIFMAFYIRIFARAFFVSEWFGAYESRTGCVCVDHYGALKDLLAEFLCINRAIWQWYCNGIMLSMCSFYSFWSGGANPKQIYIAVIIFNIICFCTHI